MHRAGIHNSSRRHFRCLLGATVLTGVILAGNASAAGAPDDASKKQTSSCVACHTDVEKLRAEAALVPVLTGSALQAGKG